MFGASRNWGSCTRVSTSVFVAQTWLKMEFFIYTYRHGKSILLCSGQLRMQTSWRIHALYKDPFISVGASLISQSSDSSRNCYSWKCTSLIRIQTKYYVKNKTGFHKKFHLIPTLLTTSFRGYGTACYLHVRACATLARVADYNSNCCYMNSNIKTSVMMFRFFY